MQQVAHAYSLCYSYTPNVDEMLYIISSTYATADCIALPCAQQVTD